MTEIVEVKDATQKWVEVMRKIAVDADWLAGNVKLGGIRSIRSPAETEKFVRDREFCEKLAITLGVRE